MKTANVQHTEKVWTLETSNQQLRDAVGTIIILTLPHLAAKASSYCIAHPGGWLYYLIIQPTKSHATLDQIADCLKRTFEAGRLDKTSEAH